MLSEFEPFTEEWFMERRVLMLQPRARMYHKAIQVYRYADQAGYTARYNDGTRYWYRYPSDLVRSLVAGAPLLMPARCWIRDDGGVQTVDWMDLPPAKTREGKETNGQG